MTKVNHYISWKFYFWNWENWNRFRSRWNLPHLLVLLCCCSCSLSLPPLHHRPNHRRPPPAARGWPVPNSREESEKGRRMEGWDLEGDWGLKKDLERLDLRLFSWVLGWRWGMKRDEWGLSCLPLLHKSPLIIMYYTYSQHLSSLI